MTERPLGPVMGDIKGGALSAAERSRLQHPLLGGLILFARNYQSPQQLAELCGEIRALRPDILLAVDTEGGRVQRFREGFTRLPPLASYGERHADGPEAALELARLGGQVLGAELAQFDIDLPFAPVLDLDGGVSGIIGDRALHAEPAIVAQLAAAHCDGLHAGGVATTGKHFPGHGHVAPDSHTELPVDGRKLEWLQAHDMHPYSVLLPRLDAIMVAHIVYPLVDAQPASFSARWLGEILRGDMGFAGAIFADDLSMGGARGQGDIIARAEAAFAAGCDMLPVCNAPDDLDALLEGWDCAEPARGAQRLARLRRQGPAPALPQAAYGPLYEAGLIAQREPPPLRGPASATA